jgi:RHH-type rel operon transcriptional repressor/antitoxin RelB
MYFIIKERFGMSLSVTVTFRTTPELKERITNLARLTKRSTSYYYNLLLEEYLDDLEDIYLSDQVIKNIRKGKEDLIPAEEVFKELGI